MEWKIGEIKQVNGEWYQCIESPFCGECSLFATECESGTKSNLADKVFGQCSKVRRFDKKQAIFKKLEKVGEPMKIHNRLVLKVEADAYKCMGCCFYSKAKCELTMQECEHYDCAEGTKFIEIKQSKEDMEEGKLDPHMEKVIDEAAQKLGDEISKQLEANINKQRMKPFNLEAAKAGRPVCTRDGRKARIICFDLNNDEYPIVVAITNNGEENEIHKYSIDGKICTICTIKEDDLMMLPKKKEGWIIVSKNATIYDSLEGAKKSFDSDKELCICKAEWEE